MITLTDTDVVRLLRKNNLNSDTLQENVVAKLREKGVKLATAESRGPRQGSRSRFPRS